MSVFRMLSRSPKPPPAARESSPLPVTSLAKIAAGIAASPLWRVHVRHDAAERQPVRLIATPRYEVWVIGWAPGQAVELHDHGGSRGVLMVTEGTLTELVGLDQPHRHTMPAGSQRLLSETVVHQVGNTATVPATSIHVYSPPLSSMTFYDPVNGAPSTTRPIAEVPAVLSGHHTAQALHPAVARHG